MSDMKPYEGGKNESCTNHLGVYALGVRCLPHRCRLGLVDS
jgi:hypothetical protein